MRPRRPRLRRGTFDHSVRLEADDALGILQLAPYSVRSPIALERLQYIPAMNEVRLASDKRQGLPPAPRDAISTSPPAGKEDIP